MHALQSLNLPMCSDTLLVRYEDVEQPFRKMTHRARGLHVHFAEISSCCKLIEQWEQPLVVFEEDVLLHDEHIAECRGSPIEHGIGVHLVAGMARAQNVIHVAQILQAQVCIGIPMLFEIRESAYTTNIVQRRGDDIPTIHGTCDRIIADTVFGKRAIVDIRIDDFAVIVLLVRSTGEIEISAVMAETVIVSILILPCPVLRGQLAIPRIFHGNVLTLIVMQGVRKTGRSVRRAHLHWNNAIPFGECGLLMRRHEDFDIRMVLFRCENHVRYSALLRQTSFPQ